MVFINITFNTFSINLGSILLSSSRTLEPEIIFPSADDFYQLLGNVVVWKKLTSISIINIDKQDNKIARLILILSISHCVKNWIKNIWVRIRIDSTQKSNCFSVKKTQYFFYDNLCCFFI